MAELAQRLGLSTSTVSRALRDDRRISAVTRRRVQEEALRCGYRPNPMVSALMAMRRSARAGDETVALLTDYRGGGDWRTKDVCRWEEEGIRRRADELGFRVEEFRLGDFGHDGARLVAALGARGIRGVLLGFTRGRGRPVELDLAGFSVAGLSSYFREQAVHRAQFHGLFNVRLALERSRALGYRRIGLVSPEFNNRVSGYLWSSAMLDWQRTVPPGERCAPFLPEREDVEAEFGAWLACERPDALVVYKLPVRSWLAKRGLRVPEDVGVAQLIRSREELRDCAGIDGLLQQVGAAAFDLVVEGLNTNRTGLPEHPKEVLIRGRWQAGATLQEVPGDP